MLWKRDIQPKVIEELGELSVPDMGKELVRRWVNLDKGQIEKYENMARQEREKGEVSWSNYRLNFFVNCGIQLQF